jgi:hypothetical protein
MCTVLLPPGVNPVAVKIMIIIIIPFLVLTSYRMYTVYTCVWIPSNSILFHELSQAVGCWPVVGMSSPNGAIVDRWGTGTGLLWTEGRWDWGFSENFFGSRLSVSCYCIMIPLSYSCACNVYFTAHTILRCASPWNYFVCGILMNTSTDIRTDTRLFKSANRQICGIVFINLYQQCIRHSENYQHHEIGFRVLNVFLPKF